MILEPVEEPMLEPAPELQSPPGETPVVSAVSSGSPSPAAEESPAIRIPPEPDRARPELDLPAEVSIRQGVAQRMKVQVRRGGDTGPVSLRFTNLPPGVAIECRDIPAGAASTEAVVSASTDAVATVTEVGVVATLGAERAESRVRLCVLASPAVPYQRGRDHLARGAYDRASAEFTEAIRLDPKHAWAYCYRAVATYLGGNPRKALADYSEAIRLMPNSAMVYGARGRIHYDLGAHDKALADYSEAIRLQPDNAIAYSARGRIYDDLGKYDKALADCSEAIRLMPDDVAARYRRGLVRYHASDYASAIDDFTEVIRLDSKYAWAYRSRGDAYARLGDGTRAGADRDLALRLAAAQARPVSDREAVPLPNPPTAMPRERPTLKASPAGRETSQSGRVEPDDQESPLNRGSAPRRSPGVPLRTKFASSSRNRFHVPSARDVAAASPPMPRPRHGLACRSSWIPAALGLMIALGSGMAVRAEEGIPKPEHPTPDAVRAHWKNLNGPWQFRFDPKDEGRSGGWSEPDAPGFDRTITVPFGWESELSGIQQVDYRGVAWYRRTFRVPDDFPEDRPRPAPFRRGRLAGRRLGQRTTRRHPRGGIHPVLGRYHRGPQAQAGGNGRRDRARLRPDRPQPADRQAGGLVHADLGDLADRLARVPPQGPHRAIRRSRRRSTRPEPPSTWRWPACPRAARPSRSDRTTRPSPRSRPRSRRSRARSCDVDGSAIPRRRGPGRGPQALVARDAPPL